MGALIGLPIALVGVVVTAAIIGAIFIAIFGGAAVATKATARAAAGLPAEPTEEELAAKANQAKIEAEIAEAVQAAEASAAAREARRPKTSEQAQTQLAAARKAVAVAEAHEIEIAKAAKASGGGWADVSDAREAVAAAKELAEETAQDAKGFGVTGIVGSGEEDHSQQAAPAELPTARKSGSVETSSRSGGLQMPVHLWKPTAPMAPLVGGNWRGPSPQMQPSILPVPTTSLRYIKQAPQAPAPPALRSRAPHMAARALVAALRRA